MPEYRTLGEVALDLKFTPRRLREVIRRRRIPVLRDGRDIRFDDLALRALEEALRSPSRSPAGETPARSPSRAPSNLPMAPDAAYAAALKATTSPSPGKRRRSSKRDCCATPGTANVVAFGLSPRRS
jgi:hypothetical protein